MSVFFAGFFAALSGFWGQLRQITPLTSRAVDEGTASDGDTTLATEAEPQLFLSDAPEPEIEASGDVEMQNIPPVVEQGTQAAAPDATVAVTFQEGVEAEEEAATQRSEDIEVDGEEAVTPIVEAERISEVPEDMSRGEGDMGILEPVPESTDAEAVPVAAPPSLETGIETETETETEAGAEAETSTDVASDARQGHSGIAQGAAAGVSQDEEVVEPEAQVVVLVAADEDTKTETIEDIVPPPSDDHSALAQGDVGTEISEPAIVTTGEAGAHATTPPAQTGPQGDAPEDSVEPAQQDHGGMQHGATYDEMSAAQNPADHSDHSGMSVTETEAQAITPQGADTEDHGTHDAMPMGETPVEADTAHHDMSGDMQGHDHYDMAYPTPPGIGASLSEIATYLTALADMAETHMHDAGSDQHAEHEAAMDLAPRGDATHVAIGDGAWDDPAIWSGGEVPGHDAAVLIPPGVTVTYGTVSDAELFTLRIDGKLAFDTDTDSQIVFDTMLVSPSGHLEIGSLDNPVDPAVNIDLIVADNGPIDIAWDPMLLSRGIISHGKADIHGAAKDSHEKVIEDPMAGDTSVMFADIPEGWQVGDKIVIAGTRYDGYKWDNEILAKRHHPSEDEVRIISEISGNTVYFEDPLDFDHDTPRGDLKTSVANYTRNVSVESESGAESDIFARGHVMFMHSDEVDVRYAEFLELGRTDKSTTSFATDHLNRLHFDSNLQGRYGLHLHRTGVDDLDNPTILQGNAVFGSPGWGIVHHDANAIIDNNATFDTFGAGYVAETGNETGVWSNNIAINAQGQGWGNPKLFVNLGLFDTARSGDGFWFQGRLVDSVDNVAASVNAGFSYFHRNGDDRMISVDSDNFAFPNALAGETSGADDVPIRSFSGNETFASNFGLHVVKANPNQEHDVWSHLEDFTAWEVRTGAHLEYTSHYILSDFDVIGKQSTPYSPAQEGISLGNNTTEIVIKDSDIEGFPVGIDLNKKLVSAPQDPSVHNYFVVNTAISGAKTDLGKFDPAHDTLIADPDLTSVVPTLDLDGPLTYREGHLDPEAREVEISGTKTDALGTTDMPGGTDNFDVGRKKVIQTLEDEGYWTTPDGQNYFLLEVYFSERLSGEVYVEHHPVWLNDNVPLGNKYFAYAEAKDNGVQAITEMPDGTLMAGDQPLGVPQKAVPFAHLTEEDAGSEPHMHATEMSGDMIMATLTSSASDMPEDSAEAELDAQLDETII